MSAVLWLLFAFSSSGFAHDYISHRHAAATFRTDKDQAVVFDMMLTLQLTGRRALLLQERFDLNRDGRFSEVEALLVAAEVRSEAFGGLNYQCSDVQLKPKAVKQKVHRRSSASVTIAFLLSYEVPTECAHRIVVQSPRNGQRKGLENVAFMVSAMPPLQIDNKRQLRFTLRPDQQRKLSIDSTAL